MARQAVQRSVDLSVDAPADLTALVDDLRVSDGCRVWCRAATGRGLWCLDRGSTATVDGATCVATLSGAGRWLWYGSGGGPGGGPLQSTWYVSAATGSDADTGLDAAHPVASWAEVVRRIGVSPVVRAPFYARFMDAVVSEDVHFHPLVLGGYVLIEGTATQVDAGTLTAAPTKRDKTTGTYLEVTDAAQVWAPHVGASLLHDATVDAYAWPIKDAGGNKARLTPLVSANPTAYLGPTEVTTEAIGDAYTLSTLTRFTGRLDVVAQGVIAVDAGVSTTLTVRYADVATVGGVSRFAAHAAWMVLLHCRLSDSVLLDGVHVVDCLFAAGGGISPSSSSSLSVQVYGGGSLVTIALSKTAAVEFFMGFLMQGGELEPIFAGATVAIFDAMFADWGGSAIAVTGGATLWLAAADCVSGSSAVADSVIFRVKCGVVVNVSNGTWQSTVQARGAAVGYEFKLNDKTQGSPYVPGAGLAAAEVAYTFANLDAAAGAAGFGGSTSRADAFASMTKAA